MRKILIAHSRLYLLIISFILAVPCLWAQELSKDQILKNMAHDLNVLKNKAKDKENNLQSLQDPRLRAAQEQELSELIKKIEKAKLRFLGQAAGINTQEEGALSVQGGMPSKRDVIQELQDLLIPVIDGLQRVSARPRKIEAMRRDLALSQDKLETISKGITAIGQLFSLSQDEELKAGLQEAFDQLGLQQSDIKYHIEEVQSNLNIELTQDKSVMEAGSDLLRGFFGQRGKNLFLALMVFLMIGWSFWRLKQMGFPEKFITSEHLLWMKRPLSFLHGIITFVVSFLGAMLCLYFLNDWLLVTFFSLVLFSIIWSLKQVAPKFIKEARFVLNLGTVKEKERIIWKGIPWKVESLGLYSVLVNEELEGGQIRVAAKDLLSEYSRVYKSSEPWFPTRKGDWICIGDLEGQVLLQTPEQVLVKTRNGTKKIFPSAHFIELAPENYGEGFLVESYFPLHFKYLSQIEEILAQISHLMNEKLKTQTDLSTFTADIYQVGSYSLQCYFSLHVKSVKLKSRFSWECWLNRELLACCQDLQLEIPKLDWFPSKEVR